jgi:membrane protein implicated in regulation of membrane protease activity
VSDISDPSIPVKSVPADFRNSKKASSFKQIFSSYLFLPESVRFETQEPGESIILLLRRHWITNIHWLIVSFMLIIIPLFLFPAVFYSGIVPAQKAISLLIFSMFFWYLLAFSYAFINFLVWYFTVSIVSSSRIIDIDFANILNKKFAGTRISKVEDVTMRAGGFISSIFDFGKVEVQTAAKEAQFIFDDIPHPEEVVRVINQLMGKTEEDNGENT